MFYPMAMEVESQKEVFIYFFISLLGRRVMWYTFDLEKKKRQQCDQIDWNAHKSIIWRAVKRFKQKIMRTPGELVVICIEKKIIFKDISKLQLIKGSRDILYIKFLLFFVVCHSRVLIGLCIIKKYREIQELSEK